MAYFDDEPFLRK